MEIKGFHKYVCINIEKSNIRFGNDIHSFLNKVKVGDFIYAEKLPFDFDYYWRVKGDEFYFSCRNKLDVYGGYNLSETEFREHFISLAEWREKQINSILED